MYNAKVIDYFTNPRNVGRLPDANGIGMAGNPEDGDQIWIYVQIQGGKIIAAGFRALGCAAAIATASILTELVMGKTLPEALLITNADIATALGGLPAPKLKCSNFAADALHAAIENFQQSTQP
jgi:nitrogen fixation NifU-like protein